MGEAGPAGPIGESGPPGPEVAMLSFSTCIYPY